VRGWGLKRATPLLSNGTAQGASALPTFHSRTEPALLEIGPAAGQRSTRTQRSSFRAACARWRCAFCGRTPMRWSSRGTWRALPKCCACTTPAWRPAPTTSGPKRCLQTQAVAVSSALVGWAAFSRAQAGGTALTQLQSAADESQPRLIGTLPQRPPCPPTQTRRSRACRRRRCS
jgi:hypothetical protein